MVSFDVVRSAGLAAGLDAVGVTGAERFDTAEGIIVRRKAEGLHDGMFFTYGRPDRSADPARVLPGARSLVTGARRYLRADPEPPRRPAGRVARYAWRDHYADLTTGLEAMATVLRDAGFDAVVLADDNRLIDRAAAHRAGLGWFGKNTNLLLTGRGSWFVLGGVLTTAEVDGAAVEPVADGCGPCRRCQPACPTGALDVAGQLDAGRCLAWLVQKPGSFPHQFREALGHRLYGCDDCQEACPPNLADERNHPPPAAAPDDTAWIDLVDLLSSDDDALMAAHGRWFIPRRRPEYLRRNALIVLGNVADPDDEGVVDVVAAALGHADPVVRAPAVWAARRLGLDRLLAVVADDGDAEVQAELAATVAPRHPAAS